MATSNCDAIDTATARIHQAQAILGMLANAGTDRDDFGANSHTTVMHSLWAVQDMLAQASRAAGEIKTA